MFMLDKIAQCLAQTRRDQVRGVSKEDSCPVAGLRVAPCALAAISS